MTELLLLVFIICWLLIIYHHAIYPVMMVYLHKSSQRQGIAAKQPKVYRKICILVPAYNEAEVIAEKIRNVASLDYPKDKLQLIIACDGCKDNTAEIARKTAKEWQVADLNVLVFEFRKNRGKVDMLNQLIPTLNAQIVALSDASALISHDALRLSNAHFDSPDVGVVAATYQLMCPGSEGEQKYWDYQVRIKQGEAAIGSPVGVHGALYFFRQKLFTPMPLDTINDDVIIPMSIIKAGYKGRYDTNLIAFEIEPSTQTMEQQRRRRIAAGNFQQLLRLSTLLLPRHGGTAFSFMSGKALRALMPLILLLQLFMCVSLSLDSVFFGTVSALQMAAIISARLSLQLPKLQSSNSKLIKLLNVVFYLINGYYSGLIGTLRYILRLDRGHWTSVSKS